MMNSPKKQINWHGAVILAPMAGVTDRIFRRVAWEHGADILFTEMISAKAITYEHPQTLS